MQHISGRSSSKFFSYVIAFVLVVVSFHAFLTVWLASQAGSYVMLRLWKEFMLLALVVPVFYIAAQRPDIMRQFAKNRMMQLIAAYVALQVIGGLLAYFMGNVSPRALGYGWIVNLRFLLFFLLCAFVAHRTDWLRLHWRTIILLPSILVIVFGILQYFVLPPDVLRHFGYGPDTIPVQSLVDQKEEFLRVQSFQRGANPLGGYLLVILTSLVVLIATRNHIRLWRTVLLAAGSLCLLLTFSRSAWLGMIAAGIAAVLLCTKTTYQRRMVATVLGGLLVVSVVSLIALRNVDMFQNAVFHTDENSTSSESSNTAHATAKTEGLKDVITNPLGDGPGTAGPASVYNREAPPRIAENYFLQIGQEVGWLGLAIFILILVGLARGWWREHNATLNRVMLASLLGMVVINMLWHAWTDDTIAYIWWGLAGIAYGSQIARQHEHEARTLAARSKKKPLYAKVKV
ncbi:MAG: O-antigen ligase family protein [Candidatus Saccharimonadales bacterium]